MTWMLSILRVFPTGNDRSTFPAREEKTEYNPHRCFQALQAKIFLLFHAALPPNVQTLNILAGVSNMECPNFSRSQCTFLFALHHNWKDRRITLFPLLQLNRVPSSFLPTAFQDPGDENKIYRHNQDPFAS